MASIDQHKAEHGVEPMGSALPIAPSTYYEHARRRGEPERQPARQKRDDELRTDITRIYEANQLVYGAKKAWRQLRREDVRAARCTVARLMAKMGLRGAIRGRAFKVTTVADDRQARPLDRVGRRFEADHPNQVWVADITYVATWTGFFCVAFVIDVFSRAIVGWRVSSSLRSDWRSMRLSKPSGLVSQEAAWSIITTVGCNNCRFATPSVPPTPASKRPSAARATRTTTPSLKRSTRCSRQRSSTGEARKRAVAPSSSLCSSGSIGSTIVVCSSRSATFRRQSFEAAYYDKQANPAMVVGFN